MKKFFYLVLFTIITVACSTDGPSYRPKLLTIDQSTVPQSFKFNTTDTVKVKFTLPNACHAFHSVYYQYRDTTRIIAIRAIEYLENNCSQATIEREIKIPIRVLQRRAYLFKFWKGKDNNGKDIFEEKAVPVN